MLKKRIPVLELPRELQPIRITEDMDLSHLSPEEKEYAIAAYVLDGERYDGNNIKQSEFAKILGFTPGTMHKFLLIKRKARQKFRLSLDDTSASLILIDFLQDIKDRNSQRHDQMENDALIAMSELLRVIRSGTPDSTTNAIISNLTKLMSDYRGHQNDADRVVMELISNWMQGLKVYGVPRGGVPVAYEIAKCHNGIVVYSPEEADVIVDDIIDSGKTRDSFMSKYHGKYFYACIEGSSEWVKFPWEIETGAEDIPLRLLQFIGEDPKREGLIDTPKRFVRAWSEWTSGYREDIEKLFEAVFEDGGEDYNQMIVVKDVNIYSHCEHHLTPFFGKAKVAYIPNKRILGISKIVRVVNAYMRRVQVQERLTTQIADTLMNHLKPLGVGVLLRCRHLCMESRGVTSPGIETVTSALRGVFHDQEVREEFLNL